MLDQNVALNVITALNVGYATNMLVAPWFWLEQSEMNAEDENQIICRNIGAGLVGMGSVSYMARMSDNNELKRVALCATAAAGIGFFLNAAYSASKSEAPMRKADLVCSAIYGGSAMLALKALK